MLAFTGFTGLAAAKPQAGDLDSINITPSHPELELGDEYSDWAYSQAFARRFNLDESKVEDMTPGLLAVEFRAEASANKGVSHSCYFNIFVDDSLPIQYPEERSAGYFADLQHINKRLPWEHRQPRDKNAQPDEWMYLAALTVENITKPLVSETESRVSLEISSYRKRTFEGVSYLSLKKFDCSAILPPRYKLQILLRRKGQNKSIVNIDYGSLVKLSVPGKLHSRICPYIEKISYLSLNKLLVNEPELLNLYKENKQKLNEYPLGCKSGE